MWNRVLKRALERLELLEAKVSRAVLRGGDGGNTASLPDTQKRAAMHLAGCLPYQYFGESYQHSSWQRLLPFFKGSGRMTTTEGEVQLEMCAFNNRDLARDVEEVVNARGATLPDGRRLVIAVGERLRAHPLNAPLAQTG